MKKNKPYEEMSTLDLIKSYLISRLPRGKEKLIAQQEKINNPPEEIVINYLAVILDDNVEEVLRCQNRLAALLLSNPSFVEFDPQKEYPIVGLTKYTDGKFVSLNDSGENLSEDKIKELLDDLEIGNE